METVVVDLSSSDCHRGQKKRESCPTMRLVQGTLEDVLRRTKLYVDFLVLGGWSGAIHERASARSWAVCSHACLGPGPSRGPGNPDGLPRVD